MEQDHKKRRVNVRVYLPEKLYALMKAKTGDSKLDLSRFLRRAVERDIESEHSLGTQTDDDQQ